MSKEIDMTGMRFGRLVVTGKHGRKMVGNRSMPAWHCVCDCGGEVLVSRQELKDKRSCGCLKTDASKSSNYRHGECEDGHSRLYKIYFNMVERCTNPNNTQYQNYGDRGIKVCDEWLRDSSAFFCWAYENGYREDLTLDRIDVNSGYCPQNCRFASRKQQANNTTRNHCLTYLGETMTMAEWADRMGIPYCTLRSRINILGWPTEKALTHPVRKMYRRSQT